MIRNALAVRAKACLVRRIWSANLCVVKSMSNQKTNNIYCVYRHNTGRCLKTKLVVVVGSAHAARLGWPCHVIFSSSYLSYYSLCMSMCAIEAGTLVLSVWILKVFVVVPPFARCDSLSVCRRYRLIWVLV